MSPPQQLSAADVSLQPALGEAELAAFVSTPAARNLDRLAGDAELFDRLMFRSFEGLEWERFARALVEYGFQVLQSWIRSGLITIRCREKNARGVPEIPEAARRQEVAADLAMDTLAVALPKFRTDVLIPRLWDPRKGASIKTFFIGKCLHNFPTVYRSWARRELAQFKVVQAMRLDRNSFFQAPPDPERQVDAREKLNELDRRVTDHVTSEILDMTARGYSASEIAECLGLERVMVKSRLRRFREKHGKE